MLVWDLCVEFYFSHLFFSPIFAQQANLLICIFFPLPFFFADEFRSKVACENDSIQLVCNPYSRIAIYSASFGRTSYESIQCSQPQGVMEECKLWSLNAN